MLLMFWPALSSQACLLGISFNGFSQDSKTQPSDQNLKDQSKKTEAPAPAPRPGVHSAQARGSWRAHRWRYARHPA